MISSFGYPAGFRRLSQRRTGPRVPTSWVGWGEPRLPQTWPFLRSAQRAGAPETASGGPGPCRVSQRQTGPLMAGMHARASHHEWWACLLGKPPEAGCTSETGLVFPGPFRVLSPGQTGPFMAGEPRSADIRSVFQLPITAGRAAELVSPPHEKATGQAAISLAPVASGTMKEHTGAARAAAPTCALRLPPRGFRAGRSQRPTRRRETAAPQASPPTGW
jgi:hypothetical protein